MTVTVGFDLDLTLIDPRPGIIEAMVALAADTGLPLDGEYVAANMGPPLRDMLATVGVPEARLDWCVTRFRATYPQIVIPTTVPMPGAVAALQAVRAVGGKTVIVTGKYQRNAQLHIDALGWEIDHLVGDLWSAGKAEALKLHGASIYVGDHIGDMKGATAAGAFAVGVTTGPCDAATLTEAGADVVLDSLADFPAWFSDAAPR
ncbi:HAD family hydrolase [Kibdelosporangium phytohabitans]|uniref:Haloacid dehalogenase n=1 Tax=Kibdelosporangium phytohabitans TaxID=860235 RepID=A0A0N9HVP8_9PSEU|nr:HAD family hydrolase [Kibdelosporangium phytohabitans]ALG06027.1 haloacid dehalogenase [Kibdelosporangium phytohabitans]MBE1465901.1 phosphoglycolate phosphatase [Kibdelosporangium phytohabitans]